MTFLNPLVLFGLVAAAIPVILHLLNLRKLRTIEFSTLTFLKELQQTKIRRLKLRQLLLLIVRTLLVLMIILAFARPALRGSFLGGLGSQAHSTVVFIFDDSFSMMATDEHGEVFKQAKDAAGKFVDLLKTGDEAFLIKLSDIPKATIEPATHDFEALRTVINESRISSIRRPMDAALNLAARLLRGSMNANREVYILSDMQGTLFARSAIGRDSSSLPVFGEHIKFFVVNVGSKPAANAALDSVEVTSKILELNKPAGVYSSIRNFGSAPLRDYIVSVYLDGVRAAQGNASVDAYGSASVQLSASPKRSGFLKGYAELENDALEQDNRRYFALRIPERINVALVAASPADVQFILLAAQAGQQEGGRALLNIKQSTPEKFPLLDLKNFDVLLLSNIKSFSSDDVDRITAFTKNGGGLILFPGPDMSLENYNSTLLRALNIPPAEGIASISGDQAPLTFQKIDLDHPLFATMFEKEGKGRPQPGIESPGVRTTLKRQAGRQGRTIISLSDGSSFLTDHPMGEGKVLFYSVASTLSWSDFPLKGLFAPLVYRSILFVSSRDEMPPSYIVGDEPAITIRRPVQTADVQFKIISPDGTEELITPEALSPGTSASMISFRSKRLTMPGFYELKNGADLLMLTAVNIDPLESDTRKATGDELHRFWKRMNIPEASIQSTGSQDQLQSAVLQSRFGVELWKYCIGLALAMALLEMLIARDSRKASQQVPS
jgi:hypothetical protein